MRGSLFILLGLILMACSPNSQDSVDRIKAVVVDTFALQRQEIYCMGDRNNDSEFYCLFQSRNNILAMARQSMDVKLSSEFISYDPNFRKHSSDPACVSLLGEGTITYASVILKENSAISSFSIYKQAESHCLEIYQDAQDT